MYLKNSGNNCTFFGFSICVYGRNPGAIIGFHILLPELYRIIYPAVGDSAMPETKAMPQPVINMKLGGDAHRGESLQAVLHCAP